METSSPPLVEPLAPDRILRECHCDDELATGYVLRCAHAGDDALRLDDYTDDPPGKRFAVWRWSTDSAYYYGDDYDAALAVFYAAEEALIRGEA